MQEDDKRNKKVATDSKGLYHVVVSMEISKSSGDKADSKRIDFGELKEDKVKGLADLFSMMAANVEYIKKLSPQFEKLDKSVPQYLR